MAIPWDSVFFIDSGTDDDLSEAMYKGKLDLCGLIFPDAWTAADCTFYGCQTEDGTFVGPIEWEDSAEAFTIAGGANKLIMLDPAKFTGLYYLKLATSAGQAADRTITPIFRDFAKGS